MKQPQPAIENSSDKNTKAFPSLLAGDASTALADTNVPVNKSGEDIRQNSNMLFQQNSTFQTTSHVFNVLEHLPFSTIICNTENVILFANHRFYELMEITGEICVGKHLQEVILPVDSTGILPELSQLTLINSGTFQTELTINTAGKAKKHVLVKSVLIIDESGNPDKILTQLIDITQKKDTEVRLEKKRGAELEKFVYSTSHDLRAPLRSILGLIYIMQQETNPEVIKTYLDMIRSSVNRMDNFIKEMVDLSRNTRQPINKEEINLHEIVTQIFDMLRYIPGAEKIQFDTDIKQDKPFVSDESRIKIILNNLISNAIAYHRLNQQNPFIKVQVTSKGKYCHIEVIDNGRGIQKEHQAKIFDMFYRASDDSKGSGLGLYIVKEAVQKLNGEIRIQSKWGEGTTFSIKFFNYHK